jgi:hypothetical protein
MYAGETCLAFVPAERQFSNQLRLSEHHKTLLAFVFGQGLRNGIPITCLDDDGDGDDTSAELGFVPAERLFSC